MNYKKIYDNLIKKGQDRQTVLPYTEMHHIVPKSLGGSDDKSNLVALTLREHYLAHKLLCYIYPHERAVSCALWIMTVTTVGAIRKAAYGFNELKVNETLIKGRMRYFLETKGKNIVISSREYEQARQWFHNNMKNRKYSDEAKTHVSQGTKKGMQNRQCIEKCISGSKGCHFYHDKIDGKVYKWFPGDPDIDHNQYEWGRTPMTEEQKKKISQSNRLHKKYWIVPLLNCKYTQYTDYVMAVPNNWQEKWTNESNRLLKKYITNAVREFNIQTNFIYDKEIIFRIPNKSKNFKIISPGLFEFCSYAMLGWQEKDVTNNIVTAIQANIQNIINSNKSYISNILIEQ